MQLSQRQLPAIRIVKLQRHSSTDLRLPMFGYLDQGQMSQEQRSLEARLHDFEKSVKIKVAKFSTLKDGQAKDMETSLEQDFSGMRRIIRNLESLAEDQE